MRLYTRNTTEWLSLSWQARGLLSLLLREANSAGVIRIGKPGLAGVAVLLRGTWSEMEPHVQELLKDGCLQISDDGQSLVIPNFIEAQETKKSDAARAREYRERERDRARPAPPMMPSLTPAPLGCERLRAMLGAIAEASNKRFVVTWKRPARAHGLGAGADDTMGLPLNIWRELTQAFNNSEAELEHCEKLGRWIGAGGWSHLQPTVTPEYLIKHLHEGLTKSQAWDGQPLTQSKTGSGHQPPTWTNKDVSIEEIFEQDAIAKGKKAKGD